MTQTGQNQGLGELFPASKQEIEEVMQKEHTINELDESIATGLPSALPLRTRSEATAEINPYFMKGQANVIAELTRQK